LKGDADRDLGRMGIVRQQTKCMVTIVWKDEVTGATKERLNPPNSLIQLEEGLRINQDSNGMLWVVRGGNAE
jgi:hypothetical protein